MITAKKRRRILDRDGYRCVECGTDNEPFEVDHWHATALGGTDDDENLRTLCAHCHRIKTNRDVRMIAKGRRLDKKAGGRLPGRRRLRSANRLISRVWKRLVGGGTVRRED